MGAATLRRDRAEPQLPRSMDHPRNAIGSPPERTRERTCGHGTPRKTRSSLAFGAQFPGEWPMGGRGPTDRSGGSRGGRPAGPGRALGRTCTIWGSWRYGAPSFGGFRQQLVALPGESKAGQVRFFDTRKRTCPVFGTFGSPSGGAARSRRTVEELGLERTLRPRGRPRVERGF